MQNKANAGVEPRGCGMRHVTTSAQNKAKEGGGSGSGARRGVLCSPGALGWDHPPGAAVPHASLRARPIVVNKANLKTDGIGGHSPPYRWVMRNKAELG